MAATYLAAGPRANRKFEDGITIHSTQGLTVLFPIRLDRAVVEKEETWATDIRRTRHVGYFNGWKEHDKYRTAFERLMRDLKAET